MGLWVSGERQIQGEGGGGACSLSLNVYPKKKIEASQFSTGTVVSLGPDPRRGADLMNTLSRGVMLPPRGGLAEKKRRRKIIQAEGEQREHLEGTMRSKTRRLRTRWTLRWIDNNNGGVRRYIFIEET